jgi:hypothetical protein
MKLKKINFKKHKNQKNEDQTQNKYKIDDTTKFLKVCHKNQGPGDRNEKQEKKAHRHRTPLYKVIFLSSQGYKRYFTMQIKRKE